MGAECNQLLVLWQDDSGELGTNFFTTQDQSAWGGGPYAALASALKTCSNAKMRATQFQHNLAQVDATSAGAYPSVRDRAAFPLRTAVGTVGMFHLLAPADAIFLADNVTVDMANANVAALVAQIKATLGDAAGNPWTFVGTGRRMRVGGA